jgi:type IV pilus assembly protein PilM
MGLWTWKRRSIGPIGLDIGHDSVKMLQVRGDGQTLSVHRLIKRRLPASGEDEKIRRQGLILTIRQMLEEGDFHGHQAAMCLANDKLKVTSVRLSESDMTQTTAQLYKEAALRFGLDPGQDPIQYIPAGTVRQGDQIRQEVILFATGRQATEEDLAVLDQVGLTAVGLEPLPCALARGLDRTWHRDEDTRQTLLLLDVGHRFTTVVFSQGGEIAFVKVVPFGMERFDREIAAKLGVKPEEAETLRKAWYAVEAEGVVSQTLPIDGGSDSSSLSYSSSGHPKSLDPSVHRMLTDTLRGVAEALAREVSLCVRYYTVTFRGHQIERLLVSGGGAYEPFLLATIKAHAGVDVERARPFHGMEGLPDVGDDPSLDGGSEWAVALGLALKGWGATPCPMPAQNPGRSFVPVV